MNRLLRCVVVPVIAVATNMPGAHGEPFAPTWESIDTRPNPTWFSDAKFGIFIHWGVYSVPSWGPKKRYAEWYWHDMQNKKSETWAFHKKTYGEEFKYQDFAPRFKAELYNPAQWADIFARSGAKYVVLTSKHHDGFCMWPSHESWNWNSVDVGPHRDLAGDLMEAVRGRGLRAGFYYSMYEWYHPFYRTDVKRYVEEHMLPQMKDLVQRYKPDIIWPDGEWEHPSETWRSTEFLAWLYNESNAPKDVVVNDRWGKDCRNRHGGFATPEYGNLPKGKLIQAGRFEECQGMGHSFGYNRNEDADNYRTATELIHLLIDNVSRGGNLLLDIGPTADGRIPVIMQQRLLDMGKWLKVNGEAIFGTRKWRETKEGDLVRYTAKGKDLYAICLNWPGDVLELAAPKPSTSTTVTLIGHDPPLQWTHADGKLRIRVPPLTIDQVPSHHAHVIKLTEVN